MTSSFLCDLEREVMVFDGAMGTLLQSMATREDYGGLDGCTEALNIHRPDIVLRAHSAYLEVGCRAVETNTLGANAMVLGEYGIAHQAYDVNVAAARIARQAVDRFSTSARPCYVAGSIGPGTRLPSLGQISADEMVDIYRVAARGLLDGGVDLYIIETCQDILQAKLALIAVQDVLRETGKRLPVMVQVTVERTGTMLVGTEMSAAIVALEAYEAADVLGMNCATGPAEMIGHIRTLSSQSTRYLSVQPNAGLPENVGGRAVYSLTPDELARYLRQFVTEYGVNIVGGCCGTTPEHLKRVVEAVGGLKPRLREPNSVPSVSSLYTAVPLKQESSVLIVGERLNANGSKQFRELLQRDAFDEMVAMAREQDREGAHVLDVCTAYVGRDERRDMVELVTRLATATQLPLVVDSTEPPVIEAALKLLGGKSIINSINLEDGGERLSKVVPLCRRYGAAVIALTIDEEGMARTAARKVDIAKRIYSIVTNDYGMRPEDLLFDPLTFTLGSGAEDSRRDGVETLEALKRIKQELPGVFTLLGVSNISFGLKPAARAVLNSVFLHMAVECGLDAAIVNARHITPLHSLPEQERELARRVILDDRRSGSDPLQEFMALFEDPARSKQATQMALDAPLEERLQRAIVDGNRSGLAELLDQARQKYPPLDIINNILLEGMRTVGQLFASGEMQLPFVLQSAEVMKAAVDHLKPYMEKTIQATKGSIVLATVRGDVHDIGKNLVDIILTNNGYVVYNLGVKQPIENVIQSVQEHNADAIGLSGLLVKSTAVMKEDLEELNARGLHHLPVLLGGAALTRRYVEEELTQVYHGRVFYARDAFDGLRIMDHLTQGADFPDSGRRRTSAERDQGDLERRQRPEEPTPTPVSHDVPIPVPPFYGSRVVADIPVTEVFPYINEVSLFRGQWHFRRGAKGVAERDALIEDVARPAFEQWKRRCQEERILQPKVVYGYFPCYSEGDDLLVYRPEGEPGKWQPNPDSQPWLRFRFPRQARGRRLCIADFFAPRGSAKPDVVALQVVTVGPRATELAHELFDKGSYKDYLYLHGLSVETAEALAEYWHKRIRQELGIADKDSTDLKALFQQGYQGSRYSFGYPACPNLEDQVGIFQALNPERIGVTLTEEFQLVPEQSTSAIVVHHPEARYFNV
jgi:5-methyltetrahydrofolate--homocysteine methyltransferase